MNTSSRASPMDGVKLNIIFKGMHLYPSALLLFFVRSLVSVGVS